MSPRSQLQLRLVHHVDPLRGEEPVVQVVRDGQLVATIYGTREGVHIVSDRLDGVDRPNTPFFFQMASLPPGFVIPLLAKDEPCPWCHGAGEVDLGPADVRLCPVCQRLGHRASVEL